MTAVTIYHNPRCSKSRQTLELLRNEGIEPNVVEYLNNPPDAAQLTEIVNLLGISPRELIRSGEAAFEELQLDDPSKSDEDLISAMVGQPILIQRPIVVTEQGARIGRPPESVLELIQD